MSERFRVGGSGPVPPGSSQVTPGDSAPWPRQVDLKSKVATAKTSDNNRAAPKPKLDGPPSRLDEGEADVFQQAVYRLTYFVSPPSTAGRDPGPSAPYTLPSASTATPSPAVFHARS